MEGLDKIQTDFFEDDINYQAILKEIVKQFNEIIPNDKNEVYLGYSFRTRQIIIQLKKISSIVYKPYDQEFREIIDTQSLCSEFIHTFKESISQIILEVPELEKILQRIRIFSLKRSRIYQFINYGNSIRQSFIMLRNQWQNNSNQQEGQKDYQFHNSFNLSSLFQRENETKHNIHENKQKQYKKNIYQFDDIFQLNSESLKDKEMNQDFVNTLNFTEKEFAKTQKRIKIEQLAKDQNYQKKIGFPLMFLSYEDDLPWNLSQVIKVDQDFIEFIGTDLQKNEEISICFFINRKSEFMEMINNHYQLQKKNIKGIRELYDFYLYTVESGDTLFIVTKELVSCDIMHVIKEREKKFQQYTSSDLLQTFKFLTGTLIRIHNQNIYLKNICSSNIVFSFKDCCWKFDNLTNCVQINLEEAQAKLEDYSQDFFNWNYIDLHSIFKPEQYECFKVEGYLGYLNSDLKHLIKCQHSQISYYDLQAADRYALGKIFEKILDKLVQLIEILEIKSQPDGFESKAVDFWNRDSNVMLCQQISQNLISQDGKLNENHTTGNVVASEDVQYVPKTFSNKNKFYQELFLARGYQLIQSKRKAEQHFKNALQEIQHKSIEGKLEQILLLREISKFYSDFQMNYYEALQKTTESLYLFNQLNTPGSLKLVIQLDLKKLLLQLGKYQECIQFVILNNNSIEHESYFIFQALNIESQAQFKIGNIDLASKTMKKALNILYQYEKTSLDYLFEVEKAEALQFLGIYQHFEGNHLEAIQNLKRSAKLYMKHTLLEDFCDSLSLAAKSELSILNFKNCIATLEICLKHQVYSLQQQYLKLIDLLFMASECYRHLNIRQEETRYISEIIKIIKENDIYIDKCPERIQRLLKFEKQIEDLSNIYLPNTKINVSPILPDTNQIYSRFY
ncbi:hypothetical protein TTHERM_00263090 (macronuclear) [Tetrahymena thermophila SB210]|uniref:Tetratricopeptide repeat protein n=1 Tax=Tetrahymena thermophila (strain SB210) TaxID=312017 RepID=Q22U74_TETTS|nr:hypothetical protein TTHERM_00263090 [Tetrahymena thermophila SB210]EAR88813.1 hypothetical protein TTHERM_00263090 [Tetrahymena thermophila SB210]|eukprot:XP_001009058.1 hypothetical protein TTHERM_00263090 [Tetrahymena thermophila SB210]